MTNLTMTSGNVSVVETVEAVGDLALASSLLDFDSMATLWLDVHHARTGGGYWAGVDAPPSFEADEECSSDGPRTLQCPVSE